MRQDKNGFLLIELLVALAIFSVVAVPVLGLLFTGADVQNRAQKQTLAVALAREKMEELIGLGYERVYGEEDRDVAGFPGFVRNVAVSVPEWVEEETRIKQVMVTVVWESGGVQGELVLVTYIARR